jgi:hypothetical protein
MRQGLAQLLSMPDADGERRAWTAVLPYVRGLRDELSALVEIIESHPPDLT